jgi:hypothetical protein
MRPRGGLPLAATALRRAFFRQTGFIGTKTALFPCDHISDNNHKLPTLPPRAGAAADLAAGGIVGVVEDVGSPPVTPVMLPLLSHTPIPTGDLASAESAVMPFFELDGAPSINMAAGFRAKWGPPPDTTEQYVVYLPC